MERARSSISPFVSAMFLNQNLAVVPSVLSVREALSGSLHILTLLPQPPASPTLPLPIAARRDANDIVRLAAQFVFAEYMLLCLVCSTGLYA